MINQSHKCRILELRVARRSKDQYYNPRLQRRKYLHECLDSIINQTFKDLEIICVDDGSTDKSSEILEEYEQKDKRFTVISQPNKGVSAARNRGMQQAKGKYIMFVDSDDYIASNACELIYNSAEEKDVIFYYFLTIILVQAPVGMMEDYLTYILH